MFEPTTLVILAKTIRTLTALTQNAKTNNVNEIPAFVEYCEKINEIISLILLEFQKEILDDLIPLGVQLKVWSQSNSFTDPILKSHREKISNTLSEVADRITLIDENNIDIQFRKEMKNNFKVIFALLKALPAVIVFENKIKMLKSKDENSATSMKGGFVEWTNPTIFLTTLRGYLATGAENIPLVGSQLASLLNYGNEEDDNASGTDTA